MIERAGKLREERFIIKVVEMHYKQGLSQQEIGKKLNVSRTTISRALAQAKKHGYRTSYEGASYPVRTYPAGAC